MEFWQKALNTKMLKPLGTLAKMPIVRTNSGSTGPRVKYWKVEKLSDLRYRERWVPEYDKRYDEVIEGLSAIVLNKIDNTHEINLTKSLFSKSIGKYYSIGFFNVTTSKRNFPNVAEPFSILIRNICTLRVIQKIEIKNFNTVCDYVLPNAHLLQRTDNERSFYIYDNGTPLPVSYNVVADDETSDYYVLVNKRNLLLFFDIILNMCASNTAMEQKIVDSLADIGAMYLATQSNEASRSLFKLQNSIKTRFLEV